MLGNAKEWEQSIDDRSDIRNHSVCFNNCYSESFTTYIMVKDSDLCSGARVHHEADWLSKLLVLSKHCQATSQTAWSLLKTVVVVTRSALFRIQTVPRSNAMKQAQDVVQL